MNGRVYWSCPKCGSTSIKGSSEPRIWQRHMGVTCLKCGSFFTAEQVYERIAQIIKQKEAVKSEVEAEFSEASKLPATYRSGRFQLDSDRGISPDGEPTSVWKPPNPEDEFR